MSAQTALTRSEALSGMSSALISWILQGGRQCPTAWDVNLTASVGSFPSVEMDLFIVVHSFKGQVNLYCSSRNDLIKCMADALPEGTISFSCNITSISWGHDGKTLLVCPFYTCTKPMTLARSRGGI